jgi:hypothetical protein
VVLFASISSKRKFKNQLVSSNAVSRAIGTRRPEDARDWLSEVCDSDQKVGSSSLSECKLLITNGLHEQNGSHRSRSLCDPYAVS